MKFIRKYYPELIIALILGFFLSFPITGFLHGFITGEGYSTGLELIKGKIILGILEGVGSLLTFGAPFGDNEEANLYLRKLSAVTFFILFVLNFYLLQRRKRKLNSRQQWL